MIKAISFDFDDTLAGNFPPAYLAFHALLRRNGHKVKEQVVMDAFSRVLLMLRTDPVLEKKIAKYALYSREERQDLYNQVNRLRLEEMNLKLDNDSLDKLAGTITSGFQDLVTKKLFDDVAETLLELKLFHGELAIYIISGNRKKHIRKFLVDEGLDIYFKKILTPVKVTTLDKRELFALALSETGISPRQWLHVGNDYYSDYIFPAASRMRTLLLHRPKIIHLPVPDEKKDEVQLIHTLGEIYDWL